MKNTKYISYLASLCFYITVIFTGYAQTYYAIPDRNLRSILVRDYASVMTSDSLLDVAAARGLAQSLNLDNSNISNADGLQFFESAGLLKLRNNNLSEIPQLSSMKGLRRVYLSNNHLNALPDLSALYKLIDLYIVNNNITDLTPIAGKSTLQNLTCSANNITNLPDLSALINLQWLVISNNPIQTLPDLSFNTNLTTLDVSNTNITSIPGLPSLVNLKILTCENNSFTDLSFLNSNTTLTTLTAQNNLLTSLPDFSNKPALASVNISNNNLTFEDIIPLTLLPNFSAFTYSPQADLSLPLYSDIREGDHFSYEVVLDNGINSDQFVWYKNNVPLITSNSGLYAFAPSFMSDSGYYSVSIQNNNVPGLILKTNTAKLNVYPCIEINNLQINILSSDCREGSIIDMNGTTISGASLPLLYTLQAAGSSNNIQATSNTQFKNIAPGLYVLNVKDSKNCTTSKSFTVNKNSDCQNVFSPNGDGIMDSYFIPDAGTAQIFNTSRKLIKTLSIPAEWDGSTDNGSMADAGYYIVIINGTKTIDISLFR